MQNILFIGPMGAGKTRVGQIVAKKLHRPFYDTDQCIEIQAGVDIPFIFEKEGESGFRKREKAIVEKLTKKQGIVLATGGGSIVDPDNRHCLQQSGIIIYLSASIAAQLERAVHNKKKPLLWVEDQKKILIELSAIRNPLYENLAQLTYSTDISSMYDLVKQLVIDIRRVLS